MHDKDAPHFTRTSDRASRKVQVQKSGASEKPKQSAKAYAVWLLSKREYSAVNLEKKLLARGYENEEIEATMRFLQDNNYQSDVRYAGMKARSTAHRAGNWKIARSLSQQGIDESLAEAQIAELLPEEERAMHAASSKFSKLLAENGMTQELAQKIWRHLGYRGFSSKAIKHALDCLKNEACS